MADYEFKLVANSGVLTYVEDTLGVPPHPWTYHDGASEQYVAGTGHSYVDGYPMATWHFGYLKQAAWTTLIALFGTAQSIAYCIKTKDTSGAFVTMDCIMHKPVHGDTCRRGHYGYYDVTLRFTHMTVAA